MSLSLIADMGGTNVRFALVDDSGAIGPDMVLQCADFAGPDDAARAFLTARDGARPERGAFAVASPITGDMIEMTNSAWRFSVHHVQRQLGLSSLQVVNDFTATALSVPHLGASHLLKLGGAEPVAGAPIAVLGPGTGLGVSGLVMGSDGFWQALATEGGHVTMAATDETEAAVLAQLRHRFGHVSAERVLSGPGLLNLYEAVAALQGQPASYSTAEAVSSHGLDGSCPLCRQALTMFFVMLGTVAGNLALSLGARGGVYVAGGILPRMAQAFFASDFRRRFEAKGRFAGYLSSVPTWLVTHPEPAFAGLAALTCGR